MNAALFILILIMTYGASAFACTAVYVGKEVSVDGSTILAKSKDYQDVWANYITVTERIDNRPGRKMPVDEQNHSSHENQSGCVCMV